ncbi:MAG: dipeptide epimerase [Ignavibacteriales bacterium]|nr:dipeptide epimerase [Ignavibacteriales bacterium]
MKLTWKQYDLHLKHTFRISRSASDVAKVIIVQFEHNGIIGYGEASPTKRYGESVETIPQFLQKIDFSRFDSPLQLEDILNYADAIEQGNTSAKCAVDLALHDWMGKKLNIPLYQLWGLNPAKSAKSSFTIAIDSKEVVEQKVREAEEFPILKVKVGADNDEEMINTIRKITDKVLYVDANEGWKDKHLALERIKWLKDQNVEFVEQPMPSAQLDDIKWLRDKSDLPLIADESVLRLQEIPKLAGAFDGINIKLMKCTGLREAMRMINTARALNMKIMMGCMIETAVGISAGAHLGPLLDYADLDGNVLISDDPFDGVRNIKGELKLNNNPGLGVSLKD